MRSSAKRGTAGSGYFLEFGNNTSRCWSWKRNNCNGGELFQYVIASRVFVREEAGQFKDPVHTIRAKVRQVSLQKTGTATIAELHGSLESSALELKRYPSHSAPLKILFPGQDPGQPLGARERLKNAEHDFHVTLFS